MNDRTTMDVSLEGKVLLKKGIGGGWYIIRALMLDNIDLWGYKARSEWPLCNNGVSSSSSRVFCGGLPAPSKVLLPEEEVSPHICSFCKAGVKMTASLSYASFAERIWSFEVRFLLHLFAFPVQCITDRRTTKVTTNRWYLSINDFEYNMPSINFRNRGSRCSGGPCPSSTDDV